MVQEANGLTNDEIKQRIKHLEAQTTSWKGEVNKMRVDMSMIYNLI